MVGRPENDAEAVGATSSGGFLVATIIGVHATLQDRKTVRIVTDVALRLIKLGSLFITYEVVDYVRDLYMLVGLYSEHCIPLQHRQRSSYATRRVRREMRVCFMCIRLSTAKYSLLQTPCGSFHSAAKTHQQLGINHTSSDKAQVSRLFYGRPM